MDIADMPPIEGGIVEELLYLGALLYQTKLGHHPPEEVGELTGFNFSVNHNAGLGELSIPYGLGTNPELAENMRTVFDVIEVVYTEFEGDSITDDGTRLFFWFYIPKACVS